MQFVTKSFKTLLLLLLTSLSMSAQGWLQHYPELTDSITDQANMFSDVLKTADGGFACLSRLHSSSSGFYFMISKTDQFGNLQWSEIYDYDCFLEMGLDVGVVTMDFETTNDGGYLCAFYGATINSNDLFVMKLDAFGQKEWIESIYSISALDFAFTSFLKFIQNSDDEYILTTMKHPANCDFVCDSLNTWVNIKLTQDADVVWTSELDYPQSIAVSSNFPPRFSTIAAPDGSHIISHTRSSYDEAIFTKIDDSGNLAWEKSYAAMPGSLINWNVNSQFLSTGELVSLYGSSLLGDDYILPFYPILYKLNYATGDTIFSKRIDDGYDMTGAFCVTPDDRLVLASSLDFSFSDSLSQEKLQVTQLDSDGNLISDKSILIHDGVGVLRPNSMDMQACPDGSVIVSNHFDIDNSPTNNFLNHPVPYLLKLDPQGNLFTSKISGQIFLDDDLDCLYDSTESSLGGYVVELYPGPLYTIPDNDGRYCFDVNEGAYSIYPNILNHPYLYNSCIDSLTMIEVENYDTSGVDFPMEAIIDCPLLTIDLGIPFLRRCFDNVLYIQYCNEGTQDADSVYIELILDEYIVVDSTTYPYTLNEDNHLIFDLGESPIGQCGSILIFADVDCEAALETSACSEVYIYPNEYCGKPSALWDGSDIEVDVACEGDSVAFTIYNTGENMSEARDYIAYEDDLLSFIGNFQLNAGDSLIVKFLANGSSYRLTAEQSPYYPGNSNPQAMIEMCGMGIFSTGFITAVPQDDGNPYVDIDCLPIIGSFDPNDKLVSPTGIGEEHFTSPNTPFEYTIRFQNTGNDTAINVFILDTLSEFLDISTFESGTSSHPYEVQIIGGNIIRWDFPNIYLPDSNVNEIASHGFVQFSINQVTDNPNGTVIENSAGIYFDFNAPIITSTVFNTIQDAIYQMPNCEDFVVEHSVNCETDNQSYHLVLNFVGGNAGSSGYNIVDEQTGDLIVSNYTQNVIILGPFDSGTSYNYSVSVADHPECTETIFMTIVDCITTEVSLLDFSGRNTSKGNQIKWTTASEKNSQLFTLLKSKDGDLFTPIYEVNAKGSSNTRQDYTFLDQDNTSGISYYQLVETDIFGQAIKSEIIGVRSSSKDKMAVGLYPMPVQDQLFVNYTAPTNEKISIQIYDRLGGLLYTQTYEVTEGSNTLQINTQNLPAALYLLYLQSDAGSLGTSFLKQ